MAAGGRAESEDPDKEAEERGKLASKSLGQILTAMMDSSEAILDKRGSIDYPTGE